MESENTQMPKLPELSGKTLKAYNKLDKGLSSYMYLQNILKKLYNGIKLIIGDKYVDKTTFPERIKFYFHENQAINFYLDFSVSPSGGDNPWDLEGKIIYGVYNKSKLDYRDEGKCNICGGTIICNCIRTKPLLSLTINEHGLIESKDKLEDNWIVKLTGDTNDKLDEQDIKTVMEFHYKALEYIYLEALYFMNERYTNL